MYVGAFGKVSEGVWKDPENNVERRVAIKTLRSECAGVHLSIHLSILCSRRAWSQSGVTQFFRWVTPCTQAPSPSFLNYSLSAVFSLLSHIIPYPSFMFPLFLLPGFSSEQQLNTLFTESRLMRDFDHPNVMKFLGMCFDAPEGYPYIILPFMANGSLLEYLKRNSDTSNSTNGYPKVNE